VSASRNLPDVTDVEALRAWLEIRRDKAPGSIPVRTLSEFDSAQRQRMRRAMAENSTQQPSDEGSVPRSILRFALDGPPVARHRIESAVLGEWLKNFQATVQSVAYALNELRPPHDSGPVPKEIQRMTKLYSGPVFASSYGMILEGFPALGQSEISGIGNAGGLLDRAVNRILDLTDRAESGPGSEDAVLDVALPLGRRVISHLVELSSVLASTGADVTLTWQSLSTVSRTSRLSSDGADRCRTVLRAAELEDRTDRLNGKVVGGSKIRGVIEIEVEGGNVIVVQTSKQEVTAQLGLYADQFVMADVHVLTARSPLGREHHSYSLLNISSAQE
jgi:hypothetical protein